MITAAIATPPSNAADSTSVHSTSVEAKEFERKTLTVVLRPPGEVAPPNEIIEDESDKSPRDVVDPRGWGYETGTVEDDGEVDVAERRAGPKLRCRVPEKRKGTANDEEE